MNTGTLELLVDIENCLNDVLNDVCKEVDFDYAKASIFTSEIYKIQISNLPKYVGFGEFKKFTRRVLGYYPHKMKHIRNYNKIYATFKNEEQKNMALQTLNNFKFKGKLLDVRSAKPQEDYMLKRPNMSRDSRRDEKRNKLEKLTIEEVATPWFHLPYEQQIADKESEMKKTIANITKEILKLSLEDQTLSWILDQQDKYENMFCEMKPILSSPVIDFYRNKCEFTVGRNEDGLKSVGFRLKRYINHSCAVASPATVRNVNKTMQDVILRFEKYIRMSVKDVYNPQDFTGHWKQLTVRTNQQNRALVIVVVSQKNANLSLTLAEQNEADAEKALLHDVFRYDGSPVDSLLYIRSPTHHPPAGAPKPSLELVFGEGVLYETLLGINFRISPDAFFQCNTLAAEILYTTIGDWLKKDVQIEPADENGVNGRDVILFDVCCGTGTIGITLAPFVKKVVGVELCSQAIEDAKINAKANNITNIEFHCGKAEDLLPRLMENEERMNNDCEIIAIVDPPRPGTHQTVIKTLRKCAGLNKLIYVSCHPKAVTQNFLDLCRRRSKRMIGLPFIPKLTQPVDLFPHTPHCELIIKLERQGAL